MATTKRRRRSIVVQSNVDDDQESRLVGISVPLLPKLGKYDVRVAPVCICIWQIDLRLTQSTYRLARNAPVCICSGGQTFCGQWRWWLVAGWRIYSVWPKRLSQCRKSNSKLGIKFKAPIFLLCKMKIYSDLLDWHIFCVSPKCPL